MIASVCFVINVFEGLCGPNNGNGFFLAVLVINRVSRLAILVSNRVLFWDSSLELGMIF